MEGALIAVIFLALYSGFLTIGVVSWLGNRWYKQKQKKVRREKVFFNFLPNTREKKTLEKRSVSPVLKWH